MSLKSNSGWLTVVIGFVNGFLKVRFVMVQIFWIGRSFWFEIVGSSGV